MSSWMPGPVMRRHGAVQSCNEATWRGAVLPGVEEAAPLQALRNIKDVRVVEDQHRRFTPELQVNPLERPCRGAGYLLAHGNASGKRHHRDLRMVHEGHPGRVTLPAYDVQYARRQDVRRDLRELQSRERCELRGFEHDGVARGECWAELPRRHIERIVPGRNGPDHPEGLAANHRRVAVQVFPCGLAFQKAPGRREEPPVVDGQVHFEVDHRNGLAHVPAFEPRELLYIGGDRIRHPMQKLASLAGRLARPRLECAFCCTDGRVDVLGVA